MFRRVKRDLPRHGDHRAARAGHPGPHGVEEVLQVHDLRLPGRPHDGGGPPGPAGGQHGVFRGPHAGDGQAQLPPHQAPPHRTAQAALLLHDLRPQAPQRGQVQVDGPGPQLTAPGVAQLRPAQPGQHGPQENDRGAHLPHQRVGDGTARGLGGVHQQGLFLPLHPAAQQPQDLPRGRHIGQVGTVVEDALARSQKGGGQDGQNAVFRPLDPQPSGKRHAAANFKMTHGIASNYMLDSGYPMPKTAKWFLALR